MQKKRAALYVRVSSGSQTVKNQLRSLREVAKRDGWQIVDVFEDVSSGAKSRDQRPGYDALLRGITQRKYSIVACWSICRLSRSLADLLSFMGELNATGTHLFCFQQGIDSQTIGGRLLFQLLGAIAEWERGQIRERVMSGLARARSEGKRLGRPRVGPEVEAAILRERANGKGMRRVAQDLKVGVSVVQRVINASRRKQSRRAA